MPPKQRRGTRAPARPQGNALTVAALSPQRVKPQALPPQITDTIRVNKRIQVTVGSDVTPADIDITPVMLMAGVPGGITYWNRVRFERIDVWGGTSTSLGMRVMSQSGWDQPPLQMSDTGATGASRSAIGFRLGLLDRARFFGTADATVLATVSVPATDMDVTIHAVVELMSSTL